jgi:hypothetical protein
LAVALGDPAGIGAEIVLKALARAGLNAPVVLVGCRRWLEEQHRQLRVAGCTALADPAGICMVDLPLAEPITPGQTDAAAGAASFAWLTQATQLVLEGRCRALVTAPIAKVVGASSAFPGFFPPVEITAADLGVRAGHFPTESFTDGGVYDNLGIRAFRWLQQVRGSPLSRVFVSDAGKPFQILGDTSLGFLAQSIRATDILWDRVWQLERENFGDQNGFYFVPITRVVPLEEDPHALHPVLQREQETPRFLRCAP